MRVEKIKETRILICILTTDIQKGRSLMNAIITKLVKIIKDSEDNISREEKIKKYLEELCCQLVSEALEEIDKELAVEYGKSGWKVEHRDERVVQTSYGFVRVKRRLMKKEGEKPIYPLDKELGIRAYQRYSAYFEYIVAQLGAKSVYRVTADAINALTPITISHAQVGRIVKKVGNRYGEWEETKENKNEACNSPKCVETLYIEGDALVIKGQNKKKMELHRFQVAEGVVQTGKRRILEGVHYVAGFNYDEVKEEMANYLSNHYDLTNTVVITNSDGGIGYGKEVFDEIIGRAKRHEHFRDRYHVNRKTKERIGWAGKRIEGELKKAIRSFSWNNVMTVLNKVKSMAIDNLQIEQVERLRDYLARNWEYLADMKRRGLSDYEKIIGTCESNHRIYSYRMKKQGRRWGESGGRCMVKVITGIKNNDLREALIAKEEFFEHKPSKNFKNAVRNALKKCKNKIHEAVSHGRIFISAPTSSFIGQLSKIFNTL